MIQLIQKAVVVLLVAVLVSGCMTPREEVGTGIGGIFGAIGGNVLADSLGVDRTLGTALGAAVGAAIGMKIGSALDKYFGENDKKNLGDVLNKEGAQEVAWCSDKDGKPQQYDAPTRSVSAVQCQGGKKLTVNVSKAQSVKTSEGNQQECKVLKTEVSSNAGIGDTIHSTFCKELPNGKWQPKEA
jgi:phage tail tape-measure protein